MKINLTYFVSHPIQYQAPLLRRLAKEPAFDLKVVFEHDYSSRMYFDDGFQTNVDWDVPLSEGYENVFMDDIDVGKQVRDSDAIWLQMRKILKLSARYQKPVLMRGENWSGAMPDGFLVKKYFKSLYLDSIFKHCSAFLTIGSKNHDYYLEHGIDSEHLFSMPYAVDNDFFSNLGTAEKGLSLRHSLGIKAEEKLIIYSGKLMRRKNPHLILSAWEKIVRHSSFPLRLILVGDGEMRSELERKAPKSVLFSGFINQNELPVYYAASDLFILIAEREPWGLAINEAMACRTPVVVSDQCGAAYDLVDKNTGRMVKVGNEAELLSAVADVLSNSEKMGAAAFKKVSMWNFESNVLGLKKALGYIL